MITQISHPYEFKQGVRVLLRTLRKKDDISSKSSEMKEKIITTSQGEFEVALFEMTNRLGPNERIYSTVDERDMKKAIHLFKIRQLEADLYSEIDRTKFYLDTKNRFVSCLMSPKCKIGTLFLVDIDYDHDDEADILKQVEEKGLTTVEFYPTKNGSHLILEPFNPGIVTFDVQKNSMMLWAYRSETTLV